MYATLAYPTTGGPLVDPRPSSSILVFNPQNELLLLHRVRTSSAFPSAHVFPGGTLSEYHERVPPLGSAARHVDGPEYRLAAIRETFEESGILLARRRGDGADGPLIHLAPDEVAAARTAVHGDKVRFADWLESIGAEPDVDNLIPFTRWITPPHIPKRFSAQMYLYFLPPSDRTALPSHDGGIEHTEALFDTVPAWIRRARAGEIIMYEPQAYLIHVVGQFLDARDDDYAAQQARLREFASSPPLGPDGVPGSSPTAAIPWSAKVMCPYVAAADSTGRAVLSVESPGPELAGTGRGGDYDRVVIVRSWDSMPREVDVQWRRDVLPGTSASKL